jgi:hypothetical protein
VNRRGLDGVASVDLIDLFPCYLDRTGHELPGTPPPKSSLEGRDEEARTEEKISFHVAQESTCQTIDENTRALGVSKQTTDNSHVESLNVQQRGEIRNVHVFKSRQIAEETLLSGDAITIQGPSPQLDDAGTQVVRSIQSSEEWAPLLAGVFRSSSSIEARRFVTQFRGSSIGVRVRSEPPSLNHYD